MSALQAPGLDGWLKEAREDPRASECGMYLFHNGSVRAAARAQAYGNSESAPAVRGMLVDYD